MVFLDDPACEGLMVDEEDGSIYIEEMEDFMDALMEVSN